MVSDEATFDFVGNTLALDFVNTQNWQPRPHRDRLTAPGRVWDWGRQGGLGLATPRRQLVASDLSAARRLRDDLHVIFSAVADSGVTGIANDGAVDRLRTWYRDAVDGARPAVGADGRLRLVWLPDEPRHVPFAVAVSAFELLLHGPLDRLGSCPVCGWLFVDTTRNRSRRWCSMATCGGREKARRYYRRQH